MYDQNIKKRKAEHLDIFRDKNVSFSKTSGFENFSLLHSSLPEQNIDNIDITENFLGYKLDFPFMINAITGGEKKGKLLNKELASIAGKYKIAFALGSLRACFEDKEAIASFAIAKKVSPNIPVLANLGGQQLLEYNIREIEDILAQIQADALTIHLNPIQEALQPEGDKNFIGISAKIKEIAKVLSKPIIVKEVGFGLPLKNIRELADNGIKWFDISGAGGTSWAKIEQNRNTMDVNIALAEEFAEFGIPTAELLAKAVKVKNVNIIASGGLNRGLDFAKAIAMGAKLGGSAGEILKKWNGNGKKSVENLIELYKKTLKIAVFITGNKNLIEYRNNHNIERC